jgi:hypothetical protein
MFEINYGFLTFEDWMSWTSKNRFFTDGPDGTFCNVPDPLVFPLLPCGLWLQSGTAT